MEVKYNKLGIDYNQTRKADPYLTRQLLHLLRPRQDGLYLDIGCGTGNYTHDLQKRGFRFIGIDPSVEMLDNARAKNQSIEWREGTAENTRLSNNSVNGIIGSLTIHHWPDLEKGFSELDRVLKYEGRIVIFTSTPEQMEGYWLNHYFPEMLKASIIQMPSLENVKNAMKSAGIEIKETKKYSIKTYLTDQFLYCGKHNPELYFDESIRHGISSFSSIANPKEVENGLVDLRKDMDSGKIQQIMKSYENDLGDYLFIVGKKTV